MVEKIKSYLQSSDDEIVELGKALIVENFTKDQFCKTNFNLYGLDWFEILKKIIEKEENESK